MKALSSLLIVLCASLAALAQNSQKSPALSDVPVPRQLTIVSQPDAPLRLASATVTWATPSDRAAVQVYIAVENVSEKSVRAYAVRRDMNSVDGPKACLWDNLLPGKVLRRGQKTGRSTWQNEPQSKPAVWIDYVELSDGVVWGKDECQYGDRLDGERAGARAQREALLKILREKSPEAVIKFIQENFESEAATEKFKRGEKPKIPPEPPPGHSKNWEGGFSFGAGTIARRVIDATRDWGITKGEIEIALWRPYDASEMK